LRATPNGMHAIADDASHLRQSPFASRYAYLSPAQSTDVRTTSIVAP
jgi:hypothetical protein